MTSRTASDSQLVRDADLAFEADIQHILGELVEEFEELRGQKVLLTGGAGFLGYFLTQSVVHWNQTRSKGNQIELVVLDNFIRGRPRWVDEIERGQSVTFIKHDITRPLPKGLPVFDFIIHAASIASPVAYRKRPIETMDANVLGLRNLLEYCTGTTSVRQKLRGLLFFSSSEIYGDPDQSNIPTMEDYPGRVSCTGPRACYDESKRFGETYCVVFAQEVDLPIKIVRPFNNFGPGMALNDGRAMSDFANNILDNEDVVLLSDGRTTRTFCYIADAVTGYFKVLLKGQAGRSYNIGTETPEVTVRELANRVVAIGAETLGYSGRVVFGESDDVDYNSDSPKRRCPSILRARTELGYSPSIELTEGLRRTLLWYWMDQRRRSQTSGQL